MQISTDVIRFKITVIILINFKEKRWAIATPNGSRTLNKMFVYLRKFCLMNNIVSFHKLQRPGAFMRINTDVVLSLLLDTNSIVVF